MNRFKKCTAFFLVVFLIFGSLTFSASAESEPTDDIDAQFMPGEVIVGIRTSGSASFQSSSSQSSSSRSSSAQAEGAFMTEALFPGVEIAEVRSLMKTEETKSQSQRSATNRSADQTEILLLTLENETEQAVWDTIESLKENPNVQYAEPNWIGTSAAAPNDPYFDINSSTHPYYGTSNPSQQKMEQWGMQNIDALEAWDIETGSADIRVGVIDSGINPHPDLVGNIDTALGISSTIYSDWYEEFGSDFDWENHGTKVAGIIGAVCDNNLGVAGVNWDVSLVSLKGSEDDDYLTTSDVIDLLNHAKINNIEVINMSYGFTAPGEYFQTNHNYFQGVKSAIDSYSGLLVVAAGNEGWDLEDTSNYPSSLSLECDNLISVAATTRSDTLVNASNWASNYGVQTVALAAPGDVMVTTDRGGDYSLFSGTSASAPHVAGAAALLMSYCENNNLTYTTQDIKDALLNGVDEIPALQGLVSTGGRLNVKNSLDWLIEELGGTPAPPTTGNLTITKDVAGDLSESAFSAGDFTFTVTKGSTTYTVQLPTTNGQWSHTLTGIPTGTYTVTETSAAQKSGYSLSKSGEGSVAVNQNATATKTITNTYTIQGVIETIEIWGVDWGSNYDDPVSQKYGCLLKIDPLPDLPNGARIVSASCQMDLWNSGNVGVGPLEVYQVTSDGMSPTISTQAEDSWDYYQNNSYIATLDITNAVTNWYETGNNYGLFFTYRDLWMDYLYIAYVVD